MDSLEKLIKFVPTWLYLLAASVLFLTIGYFQVSFDKSTGIIAAYRTVPDLLLQILGAGLAIVSIYILIYEMKEKRAIASSYRGPNLGGEWDSYDSDPSSSEAKRDGVLTLIQTGTKVKANLILTLTKSGRNVLQKFKYEGDFENAQLVLRFDREDQESLLIGAMVLHYRPTQSLLVGKAVYYDHEKKMVVSEDCGFAKRTAT
jgi:hypothetical protein